MRTPTLLVLLLVVAASLAAFWLLTNTDPVAPSRQSDESAQTTPEETATASLPSNRQATTAIDIDVRSAAETILPPRPHASDATWADILVVNEAGAPVPDATVYWFGNHARELLEADQLITGVELLIMHQQPSKLAARYGWQVRADAEGRARVTVSDQTQIAGKSFGLFGELAITPASAMPEDGYRLVLLPDHNLEVLALDEQDQPCRGLLISLIAIDQMGNLRTGGVGFTGMAVTRNDGTATIAHTRNWQRMLDERLDPESLQLRTFVHLLAPHNDDPGILIDLKSPPTGTIVLRVPSYGAVKMRVEVPGLKSTHEMFLSDDGHARFQGWMVGQPGNDGWTRFDYVPINKRFRAHSLAAANVNQLFDGPAFRGDVVEVVITPSADSIWLQARLLDEQGAPAAMHYMTVQLHGEGLPRSQQFKTDGNGLAMISIPTESAKPLELTSATISAIMPNTGYGKGHIPAMVLRPGMIDLGDIVLERGELVAAGQLLDGTEPYTKEIYVSLQTFTATPQGDPPQWRDVHDHVAQIDANGHFEVRAKLSPGEHRLYFHGEHNQPVEPVPFRVGDHDLVVQVPIAHALGASFLIPAGVDADAVQCRLISTNAQATSAGDQDRLTAMPQRAQAERCAVEWHGILAGTYTVELSLWAQPKPLAVVLDVVIPAPTAGDPRLADIDLRALVQVVTIELKEADGTPANGSGAFFPTEQMASGKWHGYPVSHDTTRLLLPPGPIDLQIMLDGYQPAPVIGNGPKITTRVFEWPRVQVRLAEPTKLPDGLKMMMQLDPINAAAENWYSPDSYPDPYDTLKSLVGVGEQVWWLDSNKIELQIGNGTHRLQVYVSRKDRKVEVQGTAPMQILPTERNITVHVPKASLQAAIDAFSK
ncbi:MAG: hypothetical protein ACJAYX_002421 [Planctomycetota bacterium]|jgi:hypothetical protein